MKNLPCLRALPLVALVVLAATVAAGCRPYATVCGDGFCEPGETPTSCPGDCGPGVCGDGTCSSARGETCSSCALDCGACPTCGDGTCNISETCLSCVADCGTCMACGDGTCSASESCMTCTLDCGTGPAVCGDRLCTGTETCTTCASDCGACPACGDASCNGTETCSTCATDCGACPSCGDARCNGSETCSTCATDCGACPSCGDAICGAGETCATCVSDCGACAGCGDAACTGTETCSTCPSDCGSCGVCGNGLCDGTETCSSCSRDCGSCSSGREPYETCTTTADCGTAGDTCVYVTNAGITRGMCTVTMCANDGQCDDDMFGALGDCLSFGGGQWNCFHRCLDDSDCYPGWGCFVPTGASGALGNVCLPEGATMSVPHYRECTSSSMCIDALQCVNFRVGAASTNLCSRTGCSTDMDCPLDLRGGRGACLGFGGSTRACWERCNVRGDCPNTVDYDCTTTVGGYVSPVPICVPR